MVSFSFDVDEKEVLENIKKGKHMSFELSGKKFKVNTSEKLSDVVKFNGTGKTFFWNKFSCSTLKEAKEIFSEELVPRLINVITDLDKEEKWK